MALDPISLKLFIRVVEEGRIAAAANSEHIAAAAVSKRLGELEGTLGTQLLIRTNKGVVPTAAGLALLGPARAALRSLEQIESQMEDYRLGVRGDVRIAANISSLSQFLPGDLKAFSARYPQVNIHLEESVSTRTLQAVASNSVDIGIFSYGSLPVDLEVRPYRRDQLMLITQADHVLAGRPKVRFRDTLDYPYVGMRADSALSIMMAAAANELARPWHVRMHVASYDVLCLMVDAGLGLALLPRQVARHHANQLALAVVEMDETWTYRELKLCVRDYAALPVAARLLVDHLQGKL
ncbi:LysR family transcriptional regulator [Stutzerimonas nosocomialis]|uniref:LysR substrate-binding domain-containing protein n=1 Tax=Stutzerimonas nosocomialis TaxID=1056496 RepID=UPI0011081322|nr:LysR substrate-binding domain-containing protein [Stutzerimonas nosocomialis]TLX56343.1 LysR family transcriptional regulator [Stutzerimonas nosocomialis]